MKKLHILIPSLVATVGMPLVSMVGCGNGETPPIAKDFATDPWSTVCYYANQGINKLHEAYANDCKNNTLIKGTLIGLERKVKINGHDHRVRVLDENADYYEQDGIKQYAALTFQFANVISDENGDGIKTAWEESRSMANYWSSTLFNFLNNDKDDQTTSVYEMMKRDVSDLTNNIKNVSRTVYVSENYVWKPETKQTRLFPLNTANCFSHVGILGTTPEFISQENALKYCKEGTQYRYYQYNGIGDTPIIVEIPVWVSFDCLKFIDCNGNKQNIWLASPRIGVDATYAPLPWCCNNNGSFEMMFSSITSNYELCVPPCFCI